MSLENFKQAPWKTSHPIYRESSLSISPAPEYASSEVLVASLYRTIGYVATGEGKVPQAGRDLDRRIQKLRDRQSSPPPEATVDVSTWSTILHGVLESPKLPNQSTKRFLQVTPLVPSTALFSGSARLSSNSWPAGGLIRRMISLGSLNQESARKLWEDLFLALTVDEGDDIFARWLEKEARAWNEFSEWQLVPIPAAEAVSLPEMDLANLRFIPARQFTKDLRSVIRAKSAMTRRQWTSLLESILRLGSASHVAWLCDVHARAWSCIAQSLTNGGPSDDKEAREAIFPKSAQYMTYGGKALNGFRDKASGYLTARLGINTVLWALEESGKPFTGDISSSRGFAFLCQYVRDNHDALNKLQTWETFLELREREARALNCKNGIGVNLLEFSRHVLGQRQTAMDLLRGYDQGYVLKKSGSSSASPWVVSLGPVAVLALVHCALSEVGGPRSIHRLGEHLGAYGIAVDRNDIARNDLGHQLRMLGLVLDSPDAESGMLLLPPFAVNKS